MGSGRRHETPESENKTLIIRGTTRSMTAAYFHQFPLPPSPREVMWGPQAEATYPSLLQWTASKPAYPLRGGRHDVCHTEEQANCSQLWEEMIYFPKLLAIQTFLKRLSGTKCFFLQDMQKSKRPMGNCLPLVGFIRYLHEEMRPFKELWLLSWLKWGATAGFLAKDCCELTYDLKRLLWLPFWE